MMRTVLRERRVVRTHCIVQRRTKLLLVAVLLPVERVKVAVKRRLVVACDHELVPVRQAAQERIERQDLSQVDGGG